MLWSVWDVPIHRWAHLYMVRLAGSFADPWDICDNGLSCTGMSTGTVSSVQLEQSYEPVVPSSRGGFIDARRSRPRAVEGTQFSKLPKKLDCLDLSRLPPLNKRRHASKFNNMIGKTLLINSCLKFSFVFWSVTFIHMNELGLANIMWFK
jgi:hypothetical protein